MTGGGRGCGGGGGLGFGGGTKTKGRRLVGLLHLGGWGGSVMGAEVRLESGALKDHCSWTGALKDLDSHFTVCEFVKDGTMAI